MNASLLRHRNALSSRGSCSSGSSSSKAANPTCCLVAPSIKPGQHASALNSLTEIRRNNVACCAAAKTGLDGGLSKPNASSSKSSKLRKARALAIETYWNLEPYSAEYEKLMREYQEDVLEPSATDTVTQFFQALNQRDLAKVFSMMSDSVIYENRALNTMLSTKAAVQRFYMNTLPCIPDGAVFVLEDVVDGGDAVGIAWHLELEGIHLPMSRGLGLYKVGEDGKLVYIRDSPEQVLSMALPALSLGSSFLKAALPAVLPAAMELGFMQSDSGNIIPFSERASLSSALPGWAAGPLSLLKQPISSFVKSPFQVNFPFSPSSDRAHQPRYSSPASAPAWPSGQGPAASNRSAPPRGGRPSVPRAAAVAAPPAAAPRGVSIPMRDLPSGVEIIDNRVRVDGSSSSTVTDTFEEDMLLCDFSFHSGDDSDEKFEAASFVDIMAGSAAINFSGIWVKETELSDAEGYVKMMDVLMLSGLQRVTARLIDGLQLEHTPHEKLSISFITIVPFFRVTEKYKFGKSVNLMRRDLRSGSQHATAEQLPSGGVRVDMKWEDPLAGSLQEEYDIREDGHLHITSSVMVGQQKHSSTQVYCRSSKSKSEILSDSKKKNSSMDEVLQAQKAKWGEK